MGFSSRVVSRNPLASNCNCHQIATLERKREDRWRKPHPVKPLEASEKKKQQLTVVVDQNNDSKNKKMDTLMVSPSYHHISPLTRSRSDVRATAMKRSNSFAVLPSQNFSRPSYGHGGGYMARSLSRSGTSLFGRTLQASALTKTAPFHTVGVQRSCPHYSDKYPYVRYSYGNPETNMSVLTQSQSFSPVGLRDIGTKRWLDGQLNTYNSSLFSKPVYGQTRYSTPVSSKNYVRYMPVEDAVDMFKKRCMTSGTLSKYWLSPATWASRREKELNLSSSIAHGNYGYGGRYTPRTFASRLSY